MVLEAILSPMALLFNSKVGGEFSQHQIFLQPVTHEVHCVVTVGATIIRMPSGFPYKQIMQN